VLSHIWIGHCLLLHEVLVVVNVWRNVARSHLVRVWVLRPRLSLLLGWVLRLLALCLGGAVVVEVYYCRKVAVTL